MAFEKQDIITLIGNVVDSLRATGTIDDASFDGTCTIIESENSLSEKEYVTINGSDYRVLEASSIDFKVKGDVTGSTGEDWKATAPYYLYGHMQEISAVLLKKGQNKENKFQKYPAIWLKLDIKGEVETSSSQEFSDITIFIVNWTDPNYKAPDRKTNNFDPVLNPLHEDFINAMANIGYFRNTIDILEHQWWDRYFWGTLIAGNSVKNYTNDWLDAIEIKLNKLETIKTC